MGDVEELGVFDGLEQLKVSQGDDDQGRHDRLDRIERAEAGVSRE